MLLPSSLIQLLWNLRSVLQMPFSLSSSDQGREEARESHTLMGGTGRGKWRRGQICLRAQELAIQVTNLFVVLIVTDHSVIFIHSVFPEFCYMTSHTVPCTGVPGRKTSQHSPWEAYNPIKETDTKTLLIPDIPGSLWSLAHLAPGLHQSIRHFPNLISSQPKLV